jgi:hypothetical protein
MSCSRLAPLLLLTLSCSAESKCEETFSCRAQQGAANSGASNGSDSGDAPQDSGGLADGSAEGSGGGNNGSGNGGSGGRSGNGGGDGNPGGSGGALGDGGNVVLCGSTRGTGCTPAQQNAVFVDAAAPADGDGSLNSPLQSIAEALALAKEQEATDIYICAGNYDESVLVTDAEGGVDLHGGFVCDGFTYDATAIPVIQPSSGEYALHIDGVTEAMLFENIAFAALDADEPGESSIAVFVSESTDVTFEHCQFTAGRGVHGADGVTEAFVEGPTAGVNWPEASLLDGNAATSTLGGPATPEFSCPGTTETTWGGKGGEITADSLDGQDGGPVGRGGAGQPASPCNPGGENGTPGDPGSDGEPGAAGGILDSSGFVPNSGEDGTVGQVGGGGGGGAGSGSGNRGGGGGGGAGGCGGAFGPGSQGGGGSIALLVYDSAITLAESSLTSGQAGSGGVADFGQTGQEGGWLGAQNPSGCPGGRGADGGTGGNGGGGAGGISVGVLWTGTTAPVLDQTTSDAITLGAAGTGGKTGGPATEGPPGFAEAVHQL